MINVPATSIEQESGIFVWILEDDALYGDSAVADLFGLDPALTTNGLPATRYLERIHADDLPVVSRLLAHAIATGAPYRAEYRVANRHGHYRQVMAFGRCFRDGKGEPAYYSGIVHPLD